MTVTSTPGQPAILQDTFREVMASVCTPVSVVTAMSDGLPYGTTVSAFASLSMRPPMVLLALDRGSDLLSVVRETRYFGLNVLGREQSDIASHSPARAAAASSPTSPGNSRLAFRAFPASAVSSPAESRS